MMDKQLKQQFPDWCFTKGNYTTVLTNDLDSLIGCSIEQQVNGYQINHFYDFNTLYVDDLDDKSKLLGIDLAVNKGKSWCNHVVKIAEDDYVNPNTANINAIYGINKSNYAKKYAGSTTLMMWSFYNLPLPDTELGKMLLLCVDVAFKGHYSNKFKDVHNQYLKLLGFEELIDLLDKYDINDFYNLIREYKLHENIHIDENGYLQTQLPLSELEGVFNLSLKLPENQYKLQKQYKTWQGKVPKDMTKSKIKYSLISFVMTGSNYCNLTYKTKEEN